VSVLEILTKGGLPPATHSMLYVTFTARQVLHKALHCLVPI